MKKEFRLLSAFVVILSGVLFFGSCSSKDKSTPPKMATLYDTLGWFIQGAHSGVTIAGQGTVMIKDPDANQAQSGGQIEAGRFAIRTLIDSAVFVIAGDPKMAPYFPTLLGEVGANNFTGYYALSKNFTDLVEDVLTGSTLYGGKSMKDAHNFSSNARFGSSTETAVNSADFDQFMSDVVTAATNLKIPTAVITRLGGILGSLKPVIVQR